MMILLKFIFQMDKKGVFMKIIQKKFDIQSIPYPVEKLADPGQILFLDIETTGFTAKNSYLYLIGCAYFSDNTWNLIQWFSEDYTCEKAILEAFMNFAKDFKFLIHFNGNNFDLPFLTQKYIQYQIPFGFDDFEGLDIYRRISPFKTFLKLPNCKQKTLEAFLGIGREDTFHGGELISVYHDYVKTPTEYAYDLLMLHNAEDMEGMLKLLPILSYSDLFSQDIVAKKVQANYYKDFNDQTNQEIIMKLVLPSPLPKAISYFTNGCYFTGSGTDGSLKVPLYEEEMKYYYSNYNDYYYLPEEDIAMHKAVASFVDKDYRRQATASTCYTRKSSAFLPEWDAVFTPFFKRDFKSKNLFFELTDELKTERSAFGKYAEHVLQMMAVTL